MAVKDVVIELGGKERILRCDLACWAAVEDHQGKQFLEMVKTFGIDMAFKDMLIMLWAMMGGSDGPPIKEISHWVDGSNLTEVLLKMGEALRDAFPREAPNPPVGSEPGTGTSPDSTPHASDSSPTSSGV